MTAVPPVPSRDDILAGLPGRRASSTLFAIENHTTRLAVEARHATAPPICERLAEVEERALLSSFAAGREQRTAPTIQDLERFAPAWQHLVPADPAVRAEIIRTLTSRSAFRPRDVPNLRAAFGVDEPSVAKAMTDRALAGFGTDDLRLGDRLRWARARLRGRVEDLPPFWTSYALTLTQTVGAGILALPIAVSAIGPIPGLSLIVLLGLINLLTISAVAETFVRTGSVRWQGAFFGRIVSTYLGRAAGTTFSAVLVLFSVVVLLVYYLGFATSLADATGVPAVVWASALFVFGVVLVGRGRLDATIVSSLAVGAVNLAVIVLLSILALRHLETANLLDVNLPPGDAFGIDPSVLELAFGVVLLAYFGHTSVANGARLVLRRAPDGRALIGGARAAILTAIGVYAVWVIAVAGAVGRDRLVTETGTALTPLAEVAGPAVFSIGLVFVVLAMGMASVQFALGLHAQTNELLAERLGPVVGFVPMSLVCGTAVALLATGRGSFTGALSLLGATLGPLLAGVFPVLLLVVSRRRGDYVPTHSPRWLGHPAIAATLYVLFLGAVVVHGAVVWTSWLERGTALAVAAGTAVLTVRIIRSGALRPTATIELRRDVHLGTTRLRVVSAGSHYPLDVVLQDRDGTSRTVHVPGGLQLPARTRRVEITLTAFRVETVDVWSHAVDPTGQSVPRSAGVALVTDGTRRPVPLTEGRAEIHAHEGTLYLDVEVARGRPDLPVGRERRS